MNETSRWVLNKDWMVSCAKCGHILNDDELRNREWYYCPHCGRSMMNSETMADEAEAEWFGDTDEGEDE